MSVTLCHSDDCSGTTILDDGTKIYWTEGYSDLLVHHTDGTKEHTLRTAGTQSSRRPNRRTNTGR